MKSEKGITLVAIVIYVIVATLIISAMAILTSYVISNAELIKNDSTYVVEYNKFNMFFIKDVKANSQANINGSIITFEDGTKYEYKLNSIYRNDKEIATNIKYALFTQGTYVVENTTKNLITVKLNIGEGDKEYEKEIEYVLKYW